jgi:hypothetical protein
VVRPGELTTVEDLISQADAAMYEQKRRRQSPPLRLSLRR